MTLSYICCFVFVVVNNVDKDTSRVLVWGVPALTVMDVDCTVCCILCDVSEFSGVLLVQLCVNSHVHAAQEGKSSVWFVPHDFVLWCLGGTATLYRKREPLVLWAACFLWGHVDIAVDTLCPEYLVLFLSHIWLENSPFLLGNGEVLTIHIIEWLLFDPPFPKLLINSWNDWT